MTTALTNTGGFRRRSGRPQWLGDGRCDPGGLTPSSWEHNNMRIEVQPLAHGWMVRSEAIDNELVFSSGRAAEQAALRLAERLAQVGTPSEIRVYLRDGTLGGRYFSPAPVSVTAPSAAARLRSWALEPA
jgi:hypothetical protein